MVPLDELEQQNPRSRIRRIVLVFLPALAFIALLAYGLAKSGSSGIEVGDAAPEFELPELSGGGSISSEELKGSPVVINFWASWCVPCRDEAPILEEAWRRYRDEGIVVLGVNVNDAQSDAKEFVEEFDITYPIVRDLHDELVDEFASAGLPETYFVDHEWNFLSTASGAKQGEESGTAYFGAISEEQLTTNIEVLLRRPPNRSRR